MPITRLSAADFRIMPWANGLGRTVELYRRADDAGRLLIRLSVADVVADGPFSSLPGIDRVLTLIEGAGFALDFAGQAPQAPARLFEPVAFSGDWLTSAIDLKGPSRDFNLMMQRGAFVADVAHLGPGEHILETTESAFLAVYIVIGNVHLAASSLSADAGDLLLIEADDQLTVKVSGAVLVIRLKARG